MVFQFLENEIFKVSSLTLREWVELKATLRAIEDDRYNCQKCLARYKGRPDGEQMLGKVQANMGCREVKAQVIHRIGDDLGFKTCIGNFARPQLHAFIGAQRRFEQGMMPYSGGLMEQPAKIIEIFGVIESHNAERAERERAKAELASRRKTVGRG